MCLIPRIVLLAALLAPCGLAWAAPPRVALVTILDGDAGLLRDGSRLALAEGVALQAGDILTTGPQTRLLRIEFPDGLGVAFGPDSRALLSPNLGGDSARKAAYVLAGWAKLSAPGAVTSGLLCATLDSSTSGGTAILEAQAGAARIFAEAGPLQVQPRAPAGGVQALKPGDMLALGAPGARPVLTSGPTPAFVQAMPRAFRDSLPSRAAAFAGKEVAPRVLGEMTYADAQPWLDGESALRRVFVKRWRSLASNAEFRRGLVAGLKAHPEWTTILYPPERASTVSPHGATVH
jgi:hypothetical protein